MSRRDEVKLSRRDNYDDTIIRPAVEEIHAEPEVGLSAAQVKERVEKGYANTPVEPPSKTVGQIIRSNLFTYFNLIFFVLAGFVIAVGSWNDLMFMPVVIANIFIGIIQELRSKKTLDKLNLLTSPQGTAVRDGQEVTLPTQDMVRDDIVIFKAGDQIFADAVVVKGECQANEALITGEADEIKKNEGAELLSGSFVVTGTCYARLVNVGADSFVSRLTLEAKRSKKSTQSDMMRSLSKLVKWIGIILIPLGIVLCVKEVVWLDRSMKEGIVSTVGALVGMIPEGLYLLTSLALVAGIMRLAQKKTLVHDMGCIETLARVDTLCVDKTGTITENKMIVEDICLLCEDRFIADDIRMIMSDYVYAMQGDNDTMAALRKYFSGEVRQRAIQTLPFTSAKKYAGVSFHEDETFVLGAPEILLGNGASEYEEKINYYSSRGCRVLLLALYDGTLNDEELTAPMMPLALILLTNKIRPEAPDTFEFFKKQGVTVKVISGDNPITVAEVAKRAGIENAEKCIDARTLTRERQLRAAAEEYTVFGRVTPDQKRRLVRAMKAAGHTVAMTGDGINDVLALKEANCSVAMASGSDVACQVSHIVLLNSNFASMPSVVMEGRRVINNIERAAALFLVKNIFSFCMALLTLVFTLPYPLTAAHLSLVSTLMIGFPSFVLALEPNKSRVTGRFLSNVIYRALPAGFTDIILILAVVLLSGTFKLSGDETSTVCAVLLGIVGLVMLIRTCMPFNKLRKALVIVVAAAFTFACLVLGSLFALSPLSWRGALTLAGAAVLSVPIMLVLAGMLDSLRSKFRGKQRRRTTEI